MYKFVFALICCNFLSAGEPPQAFAWTLKDSAGNSMVGVDFIRAAKEDRFSCRLVFRATNISGGTIGHVLVNGKIRFAAATAFDKSFMLFPDDMKKKYLAPGESMDLTGDFDAPPWEDYSKPESIKLELTSGFESPQVLDREKQEAERQKKLEAERHAAEMQIQRGCVIVYHNTIDKAQRDLTVREAKQIDYCAFRGWYGPE